MTEPANPEGFARALVDLLDIEQIDTDLFRGPRLPGAVGRVFGGQVIAQALQAAQRSTEPPKIAHSLHAYFMRPGNDDFPIIYRVVRDFDGRSFTNRRVIATQHGIPIFNMTASFQTPEDGMAHQDSMPDVPDPEGLADEAALRAARAEPASQRLQALARTGRPIEIRPTDPDSWLRSGRPGPSTKYLWIRARGSIGDDPALHRAALAYASDLGLISAAMLPHGVTGFEDDMQTASLDHALWLHEPFRIDEWLLYAMDSPWAGHARGLARGRIFTRDGRLVASTAQEGLMRRRNG